MPPRSCPVLALIFVFLITAGNSWASDGTSDPIPPAARRSAAAAVYDPVGDQLILFGGVLQGGFWINDCWGHGLANGAVWVPRLQAGPFPESRTGAALSYDSTRSRLVLFGGVHSDLNGVSYLNDVWVASPGGPGWTQLSVLGTPPPPRGYHIAAYDPAGDRLILFGGGNATTQDLGDAWELDFSATPTWNSIHLSSSPARHNAAAVLDPVGNRLVMFGGLAGGSTQNDVWAFSLSTPHKWTSLSVGGTPPSARQGASAVYDPTLGRMLVFGGEGLNDVWALNLSGSPQWTQLTFSGALPPGRANHNAIWDSARNRMVIFGGYPYLNDLWALEPSTGWTEFPEMPNPPRNYAQASFFDPARERLVLFGGADGSNMTWVHPLASNAPWTQLATSGTPPPPRREASIIYDTTRDRAVLFGGYDGSQQFNDVWFLDLTTNEWSQASPTGTPPAPRYFHSAIYDPGQDRMIVFGGTLAAASARNDTWELVFTDPPVWNQLNPSGTVPSGRMGHSAILDPVRNRMIVFSGGRPGFDSGVYNNETWALSLSGAPAWSQLTPSGTPPDVRVGHSAFYDGAQDRMMIFGGGQVLGFFYGSMFNDVWECRLSGTPTWNQLHPTGVLPPERALHGWGYDAVHGSLLIFGGFNVSPGAMDDAWVLHFGAGTTSVEPPSQSVALRLVASPNPVLARTSLRFHLDNSAPVTLSVHDLQGRRVAVLVDRVLDPGDHEVGWEPKRQSLGSGVFFYDLVAGHARTSGRLVLLK